MHLGVALGPFDVPEDLRLRSWLKMQRTHHVCAGCCSIWRAIRERWSGTNHAFSSQKDKRRNAGGKKRRAGEEEKPNDRILAQELAELLGQVMVACRQKEEIENGSRKTPGQYLRQ